MTEAKGVDFPQQRGQPAKGSAVLYPKEVGKVVGLPELPRTARLVSLALRVTTTISGQLTRAVVAGRWSLVVSAWLTCGWEWDHSAREGSLHAYDHPPTHACMHMHTLLMLMLMLMLILMLMGDAWAVCVLCV